MEFHIGYHHGKQGKFRFKHPIYIHPSVYFDNSDDIIIGRGCSISRNVRIYTHGHHHDQRTIEDHVKTNDVEVSSLTIGDDVYIGDGAIILANVNIISQGAVIGAGSVVTHDVLPYQIVAGNPAKFIKVRPH